MGQIVRRSISVMQNICTFYILKCLSAMCWNIFYLISKIFYLCDVKTIQNSVGDIARKKLLGVWKKNIFIWTKNILVWRIKIFSFKRKLFLFGPKKFFVRTTKKKFVRTKKSFIRTKKYFLPTKFFFVQSKICPGEDPDFV